MLIKHSFESSSAQWTGREEAIQNNRKSESIPAENIDAHVPSQHSLLPPEVSAEFPSTHFDNQASYRNFRRLYHLGSFPLLQPIPPEDAHSKGKNGKQHCLVQVDPDFVHYWTGVGAERLKEIEKQVQSQAKLVSGPYHKEAFVTFTGEPGANDAAEKILTKEYLKAPISTYHKSIAWDESTELKLQIPIAAFSPAIHRFARVLSKFRREDSCSVTTDVDSIYGENYMLEITGPRNAAEFVSRCFINQVQMFSEKERHRQESRQRHQFENSFEKEAQDETEVSTHGKTTSPVSDQMRQMMRLMAHPVIMITATKKGIQPSEVPVITGFETIDPRFFCAMTVSSMTTVSLSPDPIVSFNIKTPSRTLDAIMFHETFNITLLSSNTYGARIADAFARGDAENGFRQVQGVGAKISFQPRSFPRAPTVTSRGVLAHCSCRVLPSKCVEVEDHVIIVAKVRRIKLLPEAKFEHGLSYANGLFRQLGEAHSPLILEQVNFKKANKRKGREASSRAQERSNAAEEDEFQSDTPREARYHFPDVHEPIQNSQPAHVAESDESPSQRQRSWPVRSS
ncbi:MAG: hypothetical protein Q9157_002987 [Trypethelium eluteriae]